MESGRGASADGACAVRGALALTLRASRALGVAPVKLTHAPRGWRVQVSSGANFYGYIVFFILHTCVITGLIIDITAGKKRSTKLTSSFECAKWILELSVMGAIVTVGMLGARSRIDAIIKGLSIIEKINPTVTQIGSGLSKDERKRYAVLLICLLSVVVQFSGYFFGLVVNQHEIQHIINKQIMFVYTCLLLEATMAVLVELQFLFVTLLVNAALSALNDSFYTLLYIIDMRNSPSYLVSRTGLPDINYIPLAWTNFATDTLNVNLRFDIKGKNKSYVPKMASHLITCFGQICDVVREVNDSYEAVLVTLFGSFLFYLVFAPHFLIICLYESEQNGVYIAIAVLTVAAHIFHMMVGVEPGHKIEEEMRRTRLLTSQLLSRAPSCEEAVSFQLDLLYKQVQLNSVSYSLMGISFFTRTLILEIFGSAITFITIILQCRVLDKQN